MKTSKKVTLFGLVVALLGIALYIYTAYLMPAFAGYSGGGISGLPAAFMILTALAMIVLGGLLVAGSIIVVFMKSR